jgi:hypothetical protein
MAISFRGFDTPAYQFTEATWAEYQRHLGDVNYRHGVTSGLTTTVATGTRTVSVSAGVAVLPGLYVETDAAETEVFGANAGTVNRVDYVVLRGDWNNNAVTVAVVQGSSSSAPALTQVEGTMWEMPLARATIRPGVTALLASDVVVCKPIPRVMQTFSANTFAATALAYNAAAFTVATLTLPDPGWPFRLEVSGYARFNGGSTYNGYAQYQALANGTSVGYTLSEPLVHAGHHGAAMTPRTSATMTGPVTVLAQILPNGQTSTSAGVDLLGSALNHITVNQFPV